MKYYKAARARVQEVGGGGNRPVEIPAPRVHLHLFTTRPQILDKVSAG